MKEIVRRKCWEKEERKIWSEKSIVKTARTPRINRGVNWRREEIKKNVLKDFLSVAGVYGVTHMMILTKTDKSNFLRIIKNP